MKRNTHFLVTGILMTMASSVLFLTGLWIGYYSAKSENPTNKAHLSFFKCYRTGDLVYNPQLFGKMDGSPKFVPVLVDVAIVNPSMKSLKEVPCE
jgi:hypothetical protein